MTPRGWGSFPRGGCRLPYFGCFFYSFTSRTQPFRVYRVFVFALAPPCPSLRAWPTGQWSQTTGQGGWSTRRLTGYQPLWTSKGPASPSQRDTHTSDEERVARDPLHGLQQEAGEGHAFASRVRRQLLQNNREAREEVTAALKTEETLAARLTFWISSFFLKPRIRNDTFGSAVGISHSAQVPSPAMRLCSFSQASHSWCDRSHSLLCFQSHSPRSPRAWPSQSEPRPSPPPTLSCSCCPRCPAAESQSVGRTLPAALHLPHYSPSHLMSQRHLNTSTYPEMKSSPLTKAFLSTSMPVEVGSTILHPLTFPPHLGVTIDANLSMWVLIAPTSACPLSLPY